MSASAANAPPLKKFFFSLKKKWPHVKCHSKRGATQSYPRGTRYTLAHTRDSQQWVVDGWAAEGVQFFETFEFDSTRLFEIVFRGPEECVSSEEPPLIKALKKKTAAPPLEYPLHDSAGHYFFLIAFFGWKSREEGSGAFTPLKMPLKLGTTGVSE
jgi:hypothetical protein